MAIHNDKNVIKKVILYIYSSLDIIWSQSFSNFVSTLLFLSNFNSDSESDSDSDEQPLTPLLWVRLLISVALI